jgi:hypothetical protein
MSTKDWDKKTADSNIVSGFHLLKILHLLWSFDSKKL